VGGVDDRQGGAVAHAPHGAFGAGGYQLAVLAEQGTVRAEVQSGVVDGGAVRFAFVHADDEVGVGVAGSGAEGFGDRAGHHHGLVDQQGVPVVVAVPDRPGVDPDRGAGDEHLGEHHDPGSRGAGDDGESHRGMLRDEHHDGAGNREKHHQPGPRGRHADA
jgi:hypothetical protein